jgi:protein-S-isoprenylcysteine O-methyltransferase Ste14
MALTTKSKYAMDNKEELTNNKTLIRKIIVLIISIPVILALFILVPAGTVNFWQVYAYFAVILIPMFFILLYFLKNNPLFLERRLRTKEKEKPQKVIQIVFTFFFVLGFIIPGLDKRFGWSEVPVLVVVIFDVIVLLGYILIFLVFMQNSYASRVVEVEKNQKVISTGLYGIVRHPMYIGVLIMYIPTPIALGSFWGVIPMLAIPIALVLRILNEEKVLSNELPGYLEYCQKTRFRLIPFIW